MRTDNNTICVLNTRAKKFHIVSSKSNVPNGISGGWVQSLYQENDSILWVGLNGNGLNRLNLNTGVATKFINDSKDAFSLGHNSVVAIDQDNRKKIWVSLAGGGLKGWTRTHINLLVLNQVAKTQLVIMRFLLC